MKYIALFRGINVGGQKKIKMADLKSLFEANGFQNVITYIQSGNVIFDSDESDRLSIIKKMSVALIDKYNFEVEIILLTVPEICRAFDDNPFIKSEYHDIDRLYFCFLNDTPNESSIQEFIDKFSNLENIKYSNNLIYIEYKTRYSDSKINNNFIESKLKIKATTRNYNTIKEIINLTKKNN